MLPNKADFFCKKDIIIIRGTVTCLYFESLKYYFHEKLNAT